MPARESSKNAMKAERSSGFDSKDSKAEMNFFQSGSSIWPARYCAKRCTIGFVFLTFLFGIVSVRLGVCSLYGKNRAKVTFYVQEVDLLTQNRADIRN